jgi:hypothetical protein
MEVSMTWIDDLVSLGVCGEALDWARTQPDFKTAWAASQQGDHLLWLLARLAGPSTDERRPIARVAIDCANGIEYHACSDWDAGALHATKRLCTAWAEGAAFEIPSRLLRTAADAAAGDDTEERERLFAAFAAQIRARFPYPPVISPRSK